MNWLPMFAAVGVTVNLEPVAGMSEGESPMILQGGFCSLRHVPFAVAKGGDDTVGVVLGAGAVMPEGARKKEDPGEPGFP